MTRYDAVWAFAQVAPRSIEVRHMEQTAQPILAIVPAMAAFALACLAWLRHRRADMTLRQRARALCWPLAFASYLLFMAYWCARGWIDLRVGTFGVALWTAVQFACGVAVLGRRSVFEAIERLQPKRARQARAVRDACVLVGVGCASAWLVDAAWLGVSHPVGAAPFAYTASLLCIAAVALYLVGQRAGLLACLVPIAAAAFGIGQYFVVELKGTAVLPGDLLSLGTAAAVAGAYDFIFTPQIMVALGAAGVCVRALAFVRPGHVDAARRKMRAAMNLGVAAALIAGLVGACATVNVGQLLGFTYDRLEPIETYRRYGFVPGFMALLQDLPIPVPEGYVSADAQALQDELAATFDAGLGSEPGRVAAMAQFEELRPSVVVVMNETFTDLSRYEGLRAAGYEGPQTFCSLPDTLRRGTLMTSVVGGGTANTEFEFLTGSSTAFIGLGKYPYQLYDLADVPSLPDQFAAMGYGTAAMHPQDRANYSRDVVYPALGFDMFMAQEAFEGAPWYHAGVRDRVTYDKVLELLEDEDAPQFVFDLTMQNHSGYELDTVPAHDVVRYEPEGVSDEELLDELGVYAACIRTSDDDLGYFIERLRELKRPVVLVFFGDHQPSMASALNDALYPGEDAFAHEMRTYESSYLVWANYEVAGAGLPCDAEVGASQLAARVLYEIGAPLSAYQKAQLVLGRQVASINLLGYRGADGARYALDECGPYRAAIEQMQTVQYLNFGSIVQ